MSPTKRNRLVYVAGPITRDPFGCVRKSMPAFRWLRGLGLTPIMPQWSVIAEMVDPMPHSEWLAYDFTIIEHVGALLRLEGESPGADREVDFANEHNIRVFFMDDVESKCRLREWALAFHPEGELA